MTFLNLLVDFAKTGRIGPLHCGMPLTEANDLLGPGRPHPAIRLKGPDIDGYPYTWGNLELAVTQRAVSGICINSRPGSTVTLPPLVLPESASFEAAITREELISALNDAGCHHQPNSALTFGTQSSIITHPEAVCAVFSLPRSSNHNTPHSDQHYLLAMHNHTT